MLKYGKGDNINNMGDVKKEFFDLIKAKINQSYELNADKIKLLAKMFGDCIISGGVIQLFSYGHGEEFANELNFRAGGIAQYHALKLKDMELQGILNHEEVENDEVFNDLDLINRMNTIYQFNDLDMLVLVSFKGDKPLEIELAKKYKENKQKVVVITNLKSYCGTILDYADEFLDIGVYEPDIALDIKGVKACQIGTTLANITAQEITGELYAYLLDQGKTPGVLLSANVAGADAKNFALTGPYDRRIR